MKFSIILAVLALVATVTAQKWNYDDESNIGPSSWFKTWPICSGSRQSPIDIVTDETQFVSSLPVPTFKNYDRKYSATSLEIKNNGHSVVVTPKYGPHDVKAEISYRGEDWELAQFHFHWGSDASQGSEHTVNGKSYQCEVHFVHFNKKYGSLGAAVSQSDGLLVFGNFISASPHRRNNAAYQKIISKLDHIIYKDQTKSIPHFPFRTLLPKTLNKIYSYPGSLTTPGCQESVSWIVNSDVMMISQHQMDKFLRLKENAKHEHPVISLVNNFRPVQSLDGRKVQTNIMPSIMQCPRSLCDDKKNGALFRLSDEIPEIYVQCSNGIAYCRRCPSDLVFSNTIKNCVRKSH